MIAKGSNHYKWIKINRRIARGYYQIRVPNWHSADRQGWVDEHRYIIENSIGRLLKKHEIIHHINGVKLDNRKTNLAIMNNKNHSFYHAYHPIKPMAKCKKCNKSFIQKHVTNTICPNCYIKKCEWCNKKFSVYGKKYNKNRFCGTTCRNRYLNKAFPH